MTVMEQIKQRVDQLRGKSGYGIGFSGAGANPIDRIRGLIDVVKTKGAMGTVQSITKGEKPVLGQLAPNMVKQSAAVFNRLPRYRGTSDAVYEKIQSPGGTGRTEIRSRGN